MELPLVLFKDLAHNINRRDDECAGGQAKVYLCSWQNPPDAAQPFAIADGRRVVIKHCLKPLGGKFQDIDTLEAFRQAVEDGEKLLDRELDMLQLLHDRGCGERVVCPLAQTRWPGIWYDDPEERRRRMFQYRLGSVRSLMDDICNRRAPEAAQRRFLSMRFIAGEMATLLGELRKIHDPKHGAGLMLQDLTPGNILVDDEYIGGGGMRLLLADPGMAAKIRWLKDGTPGRVPPMGTHVWGCMAARNRRFDEGADLYSLSAVGAEMWLAAEGAVMPTEDVLELLGLDELPRLPQAVQFMRHLVLETVKTHHREGKLNPRVTRNLPVSWLGAWALLLGCRDHKTEADMASGRPHLRPSEAEMLPVYQQWARVAAAAEDLPSDLTSEQAEAPGCAALVTDMCGLFEQLKRLSRLEQGGELEDVPTRWLAANFMVQEHPLVAAMRAQGAVGVGEPEDLWTPARKCKDGWRHVVQSAQKAAGCVPAAHNQVSLDSCGNQRAKEAPLRNPLHDIQVGEQPGPRVAAVRPEPQPLRVAPMAVARAAEEAQVAARVSSPVGSVPTAFQPASSSGSGAALSGEDASITGSPLKRARLAPPPPPRPRAGFSPAVAVAATAGHSRGNNQAPGAGAATVGQLAMLGGIPAPAAYGAHSGFAGGGLPAAFAGTSPFQAQQGPQPAFVFGAQGLPGAAAAPTAGGLPAKLFPFGAQQMAGLPAAPAMGPGLPMQPPAQPLLLPLPQPQVPQPAARPQPVPQIGEQFAPFAYPPGTVFNQRWSKAEQAYAAQIVAAFRARCPGLTNRALYKACQSDDVAGYDVQQVQETHCARKQLIATFARCFAARYSAKESKTVSDKISHMLGHRK